VSVALPGRSRRPGALGAPEQVRRSGAAGHRRGVPRRRASADPARRQRRGAQRGVEQLSPGDEKAGPTGASRSMVGAGAQELQARRGARHPRARPHARGGADEGPRRGASTRARGKPVELSTPSGRKEAARPPGEATWSRCPRGSRPTDRAGQGRQGALAGLGRRRQRVRGGLERGAALVDGGHTADLHLRPVHARYVGRHDLSPRGTSSPWRPHHRRRP